MKTLVKTTKPKIRTPEAEQPRTTFTQLIHLTPSSSSFGGWGPKISGPTAIIKNWN